MPPPAAGVPLAGGSVAVALGLALGLTAVAPLGDGVGDALGVAALCRRWLSWNPTISAIATTATTAPAVKR